MKPIDEQRYVIGLLEGDDSIIQEIYEKFFPMVKNYFLNNNGMIDDAKDFFQNALMIIQKQGKEGLIIEQSFGGYIMRICKLRWINELNRRRKTSFDIENQPEPVTEDNIQNNLIEHEKTLLLRKHFNLLPESCKNILSRSFEGTKLNQIAKELDLNASYVRRKKGDCIAKLIESVKADPYFKEFIL